MEIELVQDVVDEFRSFGILVYPVEHVACGIDRQRWDVKGLAVGGNSGDAGSYSQANVVELTQLLHHGVNFLGILSLRIKDRLGIVEDYEGLLRR